MYDYIFIEVQPDSDPEIGTYERQVTKKVTYLYDKAKVKVETKDITRTINYIEKNNEGNIISSPVTQKVTVSRKVYTGEKTGRVVEDNWEIPANAKWESVTSPTPSEWEKPEVKVNDQYIAKAAIDEVRITPEILNNGNVVENVYYERFVPVGGDVVAKYVIEGTTTELKPATDVAKGLKVGKNYTSTAPVVGEELTATDGKVYVYKGHKDTSAAETGTVTADKQEVVYEYAPKLGGNVEVKYVIAGTEENLKDPVALVTNGHVGSDYTATKDATITKEDGRVYKLVAANNGLKTGSAGETGKVTTEKQTVTYEYELQKGDVTVNYTDTEGNAIEGKPSVKAEDQSATGKQYNTNTPELKPETITTPSGKVYNLVPESTEGTETGKVTETPQNVTYVYKLAKGDVTVTYKDTEGNKIPGYETPKTVESQSPTGKEYTTVTEALKPAKITTTDGKVYNLVPTRTEGNENGKVTEEPQNVTYVYELAKGNVTVTYKDTEGNTIEGYETPKDAEKDAPTGKDFNTATDALKPAKITTASGKVYNLVPESTEGTETGKVIETPQNVTYVYELAKGDVTVTYKDTEGKTIEGYEQPKTVESQSPTGKEYTTVTEALKPTKITTPSGKVYNLVPESTEGNETGKVTETPQNVTYVYEEVKEPEIKQKYGKVIVTYIDKDGHPLSGTTENGIKVDKSVVDTSASLVKTPYDTTDHRPATIFTETGDVYEFVKKSETSDPESGELKEGVTTVEYVYRKVITTYVDETGKEINPSDKGTKDKKDIPEYTFKETKKDKDGNTIHVYTKKSSSTPDSPKPSTPSNEESKSTVWKDTEGNVLKPQEDGTKDKGTFTGYEYVKTILVGNVTTHIFKKVITPIHDETPSHSDVPGQSDKPNHPEVPGQSDIPTHSDVTVTSDKSTQIAISNEATFVDGKRELPNTGTQSSTSSLLLGALAAMTGLGLVSRRRKDDKE